MIAVQDGEVVQVGQSRSLGKFISLRDAFGNTYVYAQLGEVASVYPVLQPRVNSSVSARISPGAGKRESTPSGPATAGAQPRSPLSEGAAISGLALGAAAPLEAAPSAPATTTTAPAPAVAPPAATPKVRVFSEGANDVYLRPLRPGVQVIAGTVLGHIGTAAAGAAEDARPISSSRSVPPAAALR